MENKLTVWWAAHKPTKRRLIQLYSALLYNANLKGFVNGQIYTGKTKALCVPGFNCYSCPGATGACPLGSLQASLAASGKQAGFYIVGIFLLYGLIAGRTICGWACPMGLIQELLHKIPTPKIKKNRITRALSYLKYLFLVVFVFAVTLWYGLKHDMAVPGFCKYICPAGTLEGAMGLLTNPNNKNYFGMLGILFTRKFIIMLAIGVLCIFCYRAFCRFICPLGALYGMFNKLALIGVKVDMGKCNGCGACVRNCKMDVRRVGDHECIHCGHCISKCSEGAISLKAGKYTLIRGNDKKEDDTTLKEEALKIKKIEKYAWCIALFVLAFALLWYNVFDNDSKKKETAEPKTQTVKNDDISDTDVQAANDGEDILSGENEDNSNRYISDAPVGYNVGEQLEDFSAVCIDGSTFRLSDNKGKVVVINLWATWCGPCVQELPHFYEFYHKHGDDVAVLACHSSLAEHDDVYEDVREFFKDKVWDMPVAIDDDDNGIFEKTGGSMTLPQTIVLNRKGEVIYNEIRSVTPEMLEKLYEKAAMGEGPGEYKKYLGTSPDPDNDGITAVIDDKEDDEKKEEAEADEELKEDEILDTEVIDDNEKGDTDKADAETGEASKEDGIEAGTDDAGINESDDKKTDVTDNAEKGISADVKYNISNERVTISGDYIKEFIDKNDIKTKEEFLKYLRKYLKNRKK